MGSQDILSLRQLKHLFKKVLFSSKTPIQQARAEYDELFYSPFLPNNVDVEEIKINRMPVTIIKPSVAIGKRTLIYAHGGAFILGSRKASCNLCASLAHLSATTLFLPEFGLAPERTFPSALEQLYYMYLSLIEEKNIPSSSIVFAGDGSGAGIMLALIHYLKEKKVRLPKGLALISPWCDLNGEERALSKKKKKDILPLEFFHYAAGQYTKDINFKNPLASPLFGEFKKFPPLFIQCGEEDILLSDTLRLSEKAEAAGIPVTKDIWPEMWHLFQVMDACTPNAYLAVERMGQWIQTLFAEKE